MWKPFGRLLMRSFPLVRFRVRISGTSKRDSGKFTAASSLLRVLLPSYIAYPNGASTSLYPCFYSGWIAPRSSDPKCCAPLAFWRNCDIIFTVHSDCLLSGHWFGGVDENLDLE